MPRLISYMNDDHMVVFSQRQRRIGRKSAAAACVYGLIISLLWIGMSVRYKVDASTWPTKSNNSVVALDIVSGNSLWRFKPPQMSSCGLELYSGCLKVTAFGESENPESVFNLDPTSGVLLSAPPADDGDKIAESSLSWMGKTGAENQRYIIKEYEPGEEKQLVIIDKQSGGIYQTVDAGDYVCMSTIWNNMVVWNLDSLCEKEIIYSYDMNRSSRSWEIKLRDYISSPHDALVQSRFEVLDGSLFISVYEYLFCVEPLSGRVLWYVDTAKDLGLTYSGDMFGGATPVSAFAKSGRYLVVAHEKRVITMDLELKEYMWHYIPDTFPSIPLPVVGMNRIYLTAGDKAKLFAGKSMMKLLQKAGVSSNKSVRP